MDSFFRTHANLVEQLNTPVRRLLMDEIDWSTRLIGIKGMRGVGKTSFLLQVAKERYGAHDRHCLYVNMNNFYFQGMGLTEFAGRFVDRGGECLLIDQVFKHPDWSRELRQCYDIYPQLQIVFTGSSVMRLKEENHEIGGIVKSYSLRGFSFREYLNLMTGNNLPPYTLHEIIADHENIEKHIFNYVNPDKYFRDYLHHGFYPFFLEKRNFEENLLKTMNMMTEVDILLIKQMGLTNLTKIKKLFYLLALEADKAPNVTSLARSVATSRATVMNYIKLLADARLINIIYPSGQTFPKKPAKTMLHNPNLHYAIYPIQAKEQDVMETFLVNSLWKDHKVNSCGRNVYLADGKHKIGVYVADARPKSQLTRDETCIFARYNTDTATGRDIPLWLFGFLY